MRAVAAPDAFSEGVWIAKEIGRLVGGVGMLEAQREGVRESVRAFSEIAVLCRTHRQMEQIETCLIHDGIPCEVFGRGAFLEDAAVQGAVELLRGLARPQEAEALRAGVQALWGCSEGASWAAAASLAESAARAEAAQEASLAGRAERAAALFPELLPLAQAVRAVEPLLRGAGPGARWTPWPRPSGARRTRTSCGCGRRRRSSGAFRICWTRSCWARRRTCAAWRAQRRPRARFG